MNFHFDVFVLESGGRSRSTKSTGGMRNRDEWNGSNEWACCTVTPFSGERLFSLFLRFLFISFPPFLPSSFFFPRPSFSFSSSFSRWFIHWILFPFRPSSFSLALFSTRCAVSSFRDGKLSPPFSLSVERVARLVTFEGLFFPVTQPAGASYLRETVAFHRGEGEKVGGINRGREFRFRGKPKTGELRVVIYDSSDGKTSEVLMSEVICFESCYALFRTG